MTRLSHWLVLAFLAFFPALGSAHGGEDHSKKEENAAAPSVQGLRAAATTEAFEVVAVVPAKGMALRLLLSELRTNAPIEGAAVDIEIGGTTRQAVAAAPGIYDVTLARRPEESVESLVSIVHGETSDLVPLTLPFGTVQAEETRFPVPPALLGAGLLAVVGILIVAVLVRRGVRRPAANGMVALIVVAFAVGGLRTAGAHGGEDHSKPSAGKAAPAAPAGGVSVLKEAQFLLDIRTVVAEESAVVSRLRTLGRVVPRPRAQANVEVPQSGRLLAPDDSGRLPSLGNWVEKGQLLAYIQVVDRIPIRAPIAGVVTEVGHGPGETVEAAENILTITDLSTVWVEAWIFQDDVGEIERASKAEITTAAYPGDLFAGRQVGLSSEVDDQSRSLVSRIDVPNPGRKLRVGMLVDVTFLLPREERAVVIPASAIVERYGKPIVYVHREPEVFEPRNVMLGTEQQDTVAVLHGVEPGDRIVVNGAYQILAAHNASGT